MEVGKECYIFGDISTQKDIKLLGNTIVYGNIFSQKNITIGPNCLIKGNVFAQENVEIYENVTIGVKGKKKSLIAGNYLRIKGRSTVYGRVRAVRGGRVVKLVVSKTNTNSTRK